VQTSAIEPLPPVFIGKMARMDTFDLNSFPLVVLLAALLIIGTTILVVETVGRRRIERARARAHRSQPPH
jgi:hypothetical protein